MTQPLWLHVATRGTGGLPRSTLTLRTQAQASPVGVRSGRLPLQLSAGVGGRCVAWPHKELRCAGVQEPEKPRKVCVQGLAECTGSTGGAGIPRTLGGPASGAQAVAPARPPSSSPGSAPQGIFCPKRGKLSACTGALKREEGSDCVLFFKPI